jgi:hypothetical protein
MYIYIYMYVYIYTFSYIFLYVGIYIYIYTYIYLYINIYILDSWLAKNNSRSDKADSLSVSLMSELQKVIGDLTFKRYIYV